MPLDHWPDLLKGTPGGIRTHNPKIRSLMRYPLRHEGLAGSKPTLENVEKNHRVRTLFFTDCILRWKPQIRALATPSNRGFRDSRENPVAIAHLHTTLNKSRDEKLIIELWDRLSPIDRD